MCFCTTVVACGGSGTTGPTSGGSPGSGGGVTARGGSGGGSSIGVGGASGKGGVVGSGGAVVGTGGRGTGQGGGVASMDGSVQGGSGGSATSTCGTCLGSMDGGMGGSAADVPIGGKGGTAGNAGGLDGGFGGKGIDGAGVSTTGGTGGTTPPWTVPIGCGNGALETPERCDDGNTTPFDGCSSSCQPEPDCAGGACSSKCGDGLVIDEDCDDGNTVDGDGCSSACKVEGGFVCAQPSLAGWIDLPAIYRDFKFRHPSEFEAGGTGSYSASPGIVKSALGANGRPVLAGGGGSSAGNIQGFDTWYVNTDGTNHATASTLRLWSNGNGAYVNRWGANGEKWAVRTYASFCGYVGSERLDSSGKPVPCTYQGDGGQNDCDLLAGQGYTMAAGSCTTSTSTTSSYYQAEYIVAYVDGNPLFFPIDDDPFSAAERTGAQIDSSPKGLYDATGMYPWDVDAQGKKILHNFSFTSEFHYWFKYEPDKAYRVELDGDDDVWVFVNKKLAIDLGGIHTAVAGSVTLDANAAATYGLVPGKVYELAVFQAERQTTSSTLKISLPGFNSAPSVCTRN